MVTDIFSLLLNSSEKKITFHWIVITHLNYLSRRKSIINHLLKQQTDGYLKFCLRVKWTF